MNYFEIRKPRWLRIVLGTALIAFVPEAALYWTDFAPENIFGILLTLSLVFIPIAAIVFSSALIIHMHRTGTKGFESVSDFCWFSFGPAALAVATVELVLLCAAVALVVFGGQFFGDNSVALATKLFLTGTLYILIVGIPAAALSVVFLSGLVLSNVTVSSENSGRD